ncbi:UNVERIFIED_CONTAM: hypothetical protein GTU68_034989 [Idotea baltica]|nr:hypothetical protein [Idotea baltica]
MGPIPEAVDTLIHPGWIVPIIPAGDVLTGFSIALKDKKIVAIVPTEETTSIEAINTHTLPEHVIMPGLINCHGHAAMSLLRGYADDQALMPWLEKHIWPAETAHVDADFVADGATLAIVEMLRSGTTCFSDMYSFPEITATVAGDIGIRCQIALPVIDAPSSWAANADEYIAKGLALLDDAKHKDIVSFVFGPHAPHTLSDESLNKIATLSAELDLGVHIHLHETAAEVLAAVERNGYRPIDTLHQLGLLGPKTQCVHMTALGKQDIALLAETGAHVVHCPASNMKLASGSCPVTALQRAGVNVALGTDSAASNNSLNLLGEMRTAALVAKLNSGDATAMPAYEALAMATINGARAMGIDDRVGSLEIGKQADIIALDMNQPETLPLYNPLSQLVYACNANQLSHSWIDGKLVVNERVVAGVDLEALTQKIQKWQHRISG